MTLGGPVLDESQKCSGSNGSRAPVRTSAPRLFDSGGFLYILFNYIFYGHNLLLIMVTLRESDKTSGILGLLPRRNNHLWHHAGIIDAR